MSRPAVEGPQPVEGSQATKGGQRVEGSQAVDASRAEQLEDAFFRTLRTRNGTTKLTYRHRLDDLNALVRPLLPADRPLELMDVAVSSGVSTGEWLASLERAGIACRMVAGDAVIDAFLISIGSRIRALIDRHGFLMHLELAGRAIELPPPSRRCGLRLHLHLVSLLRGGSAPLLRLAIRRLQRSPAWARPLNLSCRRVQLVSPSVAAAGAIEWVEDDILRDAPNAARRFHAVRAANILNRTYFDESTLVRMLIRLRERLRPLGLLIVCRTMPDHRNHATVFRLEENGRLSVVARLGDGSEITDLALRL